MFYNLLSITRLVTFSQRTAIFFALLLIFLFKLLTHSKNVIEVYPALALTLQFRPRELGSNLFPKYLCLLTSPITVGFTFYKPVVFKRSIITNLLYSNATLLWVLPCFILSTYVPCYKRMNQLSLHKRWSFLLSASSINVTKSVGNYWFGQIYWRNPEWKVLFFVKCSTATENFNHGEMIARSFCYFC